MVNRPRNINAYEFVIMASLRAQQLMKGCVPRVEGDHNAVTIAQMEVSEGRVGRLIDPTLGKREPSPYHGVRAD